MNDQLDVEVFRAGDYGEKGRWDEDSLDQIAKDYNPALHEAPVTLDHARGGPALGWVAALRRVGDRLVARLRGLNLKLLELLRAGSFKKRSVELYPALRETGRPYLRAVSFLGAAVPEVKGLADPLFADEDREALRFEDEVGRVSDPTSARRADLHPREWPDADEMRNESLGARTPSSAPEMAEDAQAITEPETAHAETGTVPSEARGLSPFLTFDDLSARLRTAGKWRPAWVERGIAEFWRALAAIDEIDVGEGQCLSPAEWFAGFLESLPPVVALGEAAPPEGGELDGLLRGGASVDPASLALHHAAVTFQQSSPGVSYAEALLRCSPRK